MDDYIITAAVGAATAAVSSLVTWLTARRREMADIRKSDAEAVGEHFETYNKMLEFYKDISDDNSRRLDELQESLRSLRDENERLRGENAALRSEVAMLRHRQDTLIKEVERLKGGGDD